MTRTALRPLMAVPPLLWAGGLLAATFIASRPTVGVLAYAASAVMYEIGSLVCHQLPQRSFYFWGAQMPVCARCTGLYAGAAVAAMASLPLRSETIRRSGWTRAQAILFIAALPTAATLIYEWVSGDMPSHWIRAAAGFPLGASVMFVLVSAATIESAVGVH